MKVLISGDRGYIGAVLAPLFLQAGHEVVGLDAGWYDGCDFGPYRLDYESRTGDIRYQTPEDLRGFDAVVHLAAISNDPIGHLNPETTFSVNAHGAAHLAEVARTAGVGRFLFSSSCSLYGAAGDAAVTEESATNPVTPYGESKILAEQLIAKLADESFSPAYLRNATAYGASPRLRTDIVVNNLCAGAQRSGEVRLASDGTAWRPLVHIEDISRAFLAVLEADREVMHDQAFNIGRDEDVMQVRAIAEAVAARYDAPVTFAAGAGADTRDYRVSFAKASEQLPAFRPQWTVPLGIEQLAGQMAAYGVEIERFTRLHQIQRLTDGGRLDELLRWR
ncbi:SDR family oxidoreductase [Nocardioides sp. BP30]|uniref:NAD-dependent epimerase/dehydratase family protein n=1 Tax=Nocardioides sp. BP30 TaxID=3036374 RepID=UPI002468EFD3|nr:SDR family oxidoreductase [Nocardioides sp. BP30]WGL51772.1 SDR family oxidoreductase [Nocardioides sp. BP30]